MLRFLERFYRDRLLLVALSAIVLTLSLGFFASRPRMYESTGRVWVDAASQGDHQNSHLTPAETAGQTLTEFLHTRAFCLKVAQRRAGSRAGATPIDEDRAFETLGAGTVIGAAGTNVVTIAYRDESPQTAGATARGLIDVYREEVLNEQTQRARTSVTFYEELVRSARADLARADGRISDYLGVSQVLGAPATTPGSDPGAPDVNLMVLQRDDDALHKRMDDLTQKLNTARLDLTVAQQASPQGLRVVDAPPVPRKALSRTKPLLMAGAGGVAAGGAISLMVLVLLVAVDGSLLHADEVEGALGLRLVGVVPHIPAPWPR